MLLCEMTSGCMRRATRVCQGGHASAHAVQGKQGQQCAVYQSNVYAVGVTLAKVMISMPHHSVGFAPVGRWTMVPQSCTVAARCSMLCSIRRARDFCATTVRTRNDL